MFNRPPTHGNPDTPGVGAPRSKPRNRIQESRSRMPALISSFSSFVFLCFGAATRLESTIYPDMAM